MSAQGLVNIMVVASAVLSLAIAGCLAFLTLGLIEHGRISTANIVIVGFTGFASVIVAAGLLSKVRAT